MKRQPVEIKASNHADYHYTYMDKMMTLHSDWKQWPACDDVKGTHNCLYKWALKLQPCDTCCNIQCPLTSVVVSVMTNIRTDCEDDDPLEGMLVSTFIITVVIWRTLDFYVGWIAYSIFVAALRVYADQLFSIRLILVTMLSIDV